MPEERLRVTHELPPGHHQAEVFPARGLDAPRAELEHVRPGDGREDGGVGGFPGIPPRGSADATGHPTGPGSAPGRCTAGASCRRAGNTTSAAGHPGPR